MKTSTSQELLPAAILGALALVASGLILYVGRDTIFFFDEWNFVLDRRGTTLDTFLEPHVGHLSLVPILIYKGLFATVGLAPYWPYRLVVVVLHLLCVGLFYLVARRRVGSWPALGLSALLLFLGSAWEVLLWPFEISYLASLGGGLGAWLLLQERGRGREVAASVLVLVALASSGVGIPIAVGLLTGLLLVPGERRRAWLMAPPLALYLLWLVLYGLPAESPESVELSNLPDTPAYVGGMAAAAAGGLSGMGDAWGELLIAAFALALGLRVARHGLSAWLAAGVVSAFGFWILTALARADVSPTSTSRYIYPSAVFLLLVGVELLAGAPIWRAWLPKRREAWVIAGLVVAWAAIGNTDPLRDGGRHLRSATYAVLPALAAIETAGQAMPADDRPQPHYAPQITAGGYLDATRQFGSALPDGLAPEIAGRGAAVDAALVQAEHIVAGSPPQDRPGGRSAPEVVQAVGGDTGRAGGCVRFTPRHVPAALDVEVPPGKALLIGNRGRTGAEVRLRRFAPDFPAGALDAVPPGEERTLSFPSDTSTSPWIARVSPAGAVLACLSG